MSIVVSLGVLQLVGGNDNGRSITCVILRKESLVSESPSSALNET